MDPNTPTFWSEHATQVIIGVIIIVIGTPIAAFILWFCRSSLKKCLQTVWQPLRHHILQFKSWWFRKDQKIADLSAENQQLRDQLKRPDRIKAFGVLWEPKEQGSTDEGKYIPICPTPGCLTILEHEVKSEYPSRRPLTDFNCIVCGFKRRVSRGYSQILHNVGNLYE